MLLKLIRGNLNWWISSKQVTARRSHGDGEVLIALRVHSPLGPGLSGAGQAGCIELSHGAMVTRMQS